jgi:hypothetical protein
MEILQAHRLADLQAALEQLVLLVEVLDELAEGFAGLVGGVEDPLFHAQEVLQGFRVVQGVQAGPGTSGP